MELIELTPEFCFEIITQNHNKYFKIQELVDEILIQEYGIEFYFIRYYNNVSLAKLKLQLIRKLSPILQKLRESGKIEKYNKKFWRIKN